ncbi:MAG: PspC domain-containing protein [Spirochaetales bacterium]|nr:PspC domain-containing protein [Spirochaetales bacterium]
MMAERTRRLYRSRDGKVMGVCQGIADWMGVQAGYVRLVVVLAFLITGFFPVGVAYIAAGIFLPEEPAGFGEEPRRDRYDNIRRDFNDLKDKVKNMEERVFDKERDWDDRFRRGK